MKRKDRYDYEEALYLATCSLSTWDLAKVREILRKLVRDALNHPDAMRRGEKTVAAIAKDLVP